MHESKPDTEQYTAISAAAVTAVGFEPAPFRTGAWSPRLRPVGQAVLCYSCSQQISGVAQQSGRLGVQYEARVGVVSHSCRGVVWVPSAAGVPLPTWLQSVRESVWRIFCMKKKHLDA